MLVPGDISRGLVVPLVSEALLGNIYMYINIYTYIKLVTLDILYILDTQVLGAPLGV